MASSVGVMEPVFYSQKWAERKEVWQLIAAQVVRSLPLSAASGLVIQGQYFYVVADALHLGMFRLDDGIFSATAFVVECRREKARKAAKPDFESLLLWPGVDYPFGALLVWQVQQTVNRLCYCRLMNRLRCRIQQLF
ncbi:MAG: hypothetical protein R3E63_02505 [Pseudomonadales bacterium]